MVDVIDYHVMKMSRLLLVVLLVFITEVLTGGSHQAPVLKNRDWLLCKYCKYYKYQSKDCEGVEASSLIVHSHQN